MLTHSALCPDYVGRKAEVAALGVSLAGVARGGDGRLLLIAGPAGMGKSALVAEALRQAQDAGLTRLEGQCSQDATVPYAPFVTALRRRTRRMSDDQVAQLFSGAASLAASLLPEVAVTLGTPPARSQEDLHAAVWRTLSNLVGESGAVLVLEDLHWADTDSLRLLAYLARETDGLPIWIVGTYRSDEMHRRHPFAALRAELARERRFDEVALEPLDVEGVRQMLSAIFDDTEVSDEFAHAVHDRTEGNPFFVEELLKVLMERGDVFRKDGQWERRDLDEIEMPQSVRDSLLTRARLMTPESLRILELAALASVTIDPSVVAKAADVSSDVVDAAIAEGLSAQILTEQRRSQGTVVAFRHALSREALADEIIGPERRAAHLKIAQALLEIHADDPKSVAAQLAEHFAAANDKTMAVEYLMVAARAAAAAGSLDERDRLHDQALALMDGDTLERLAVALQACGGARATRVYLSDLQVSFAQEALRLARLLKQPTAEAEALAVLSGHSWDLGKGQEGIELIQGALALAQGKDPDLEVLLAARYCRLRALANEQSLDDPILINAIEVATEVENFYALSSLFGTQMLLVETEQEFADVYESSVAAARRGHEIAAEGNAHVNCGFISLWRGHFALSAKALSLGADIFWRIAPSDDYGRAGEAWLASLMGDYEKAERIARPIASSPFPPSRVVALTALAEVALRSDSDEIAALVDDLMSTAAKMGESQRSVPALSMFSRYRLQGEDVEAAIPQFWETLRASMGTNEVGSHWVFSPDLALALLEAGRVAPLVEWANEIARINQRDPNTHNNAALALVTACRIAAEGRDEEAAAAFANAAALYAAMPCPSREIESLIGQAEALARLADAEEAQAILRRAHASAERIGAVQLQRRIDEARVRVSSRPVLATLLFTDMVGSTEGAAAMGDIAWRERLERHHAAVRKELTRKGGREIDTAGDGFLAAFDSPAIAVRCALAIQDALHALDIPIRAGIHTGECQEFNGKLTGLTVHIAARVSQQAQAGEVLVSSTVRELVVGLPLGFEDRGARDLKGVPGEWRLYAVVPREG